MADCGRRNASSVSPAALAALAWVSRDSTVIGGSTLGALAGAASTGLAASNSAARRGIVRGIMARTIRHFGVAEPCVIRGPDLIFWWPRRSKNRSFQFWPGWRGNPDP